jgi:hypothetical protein
VTSKFLNLAISIDFFPFLQFIRNAVKFNNRSSITCKENIMSTKRKDQETPTAPIAAAVRGNVASFDLLPGSGRFAPLTNSGNKEPYKKTANLTGGQRKDGPDQGDLLPKDEMEKNIKDQSHLTTKDLEMIVSRLGEPIQVTQPFEIATLASLAAHPEPASFDDLYTFATSECKLVVTDPTARRMIQSLIDEGFIKEASGYRLWARNRGRQPKLFSIMPKGIRHLRRVAAFYDAEPARILEAS